MKIKNEIPAAGKGSKARNFSMRLLAVGKRLVMCMKGDLRTAAAVEQKPVLAESIVKREPKVPEMVVSAQEPVNGKFGPMFTSGFC